MAVMSESPATSPSPLTGPSAGRPSAGRYRIDADHSTVTFATRHLFGLAPVRGTFTLRDGMVIMADPVAGSSVQARVAASSFRSGNPARDAAVLSPKLLDAEAYPSLTFTSTSLEPGTPEGESWLLRGELEVRGVTVPVEARVTAKPADPDGAVLHASARLSVDRYAFGLTAFRGLAGRQLTVDLDIVARRNDATSRAGR
jgi:polyisoprenoid-binding protein YceI